MNPIFKSVLFAFAGVSVSIPSAFAQGNATEPPAAEISIGGAPHKLSEEETAKELANPNTPLASLTFKNQWTHWEGSLPGADGLDSQTILFQPSFPFQLNETDSIFLRPAFPFLIDQPVVGPASTVGTETGFGDMGMDLAFGRTTQSGLLTAYGLVAGIPIGEEGLSSDTWTLGPEYFIGKISKEGVLGVFTNHQWDVSGPRETSLTTIQPIATYLLGGGWAAGSAGSMTYNWEAEQWTVPLQMQISKTTKIGDLPVKLAFEVNYYLDKPGALGQEWMVGFNITPVVPNIVAKWLKGN